MKTVIREPLVEQLMRTEGKAEIIDGRVMAWPPSGAAPSFAAGRVQVALHRHAEVTAHGQVGGSLLAFLSRLEPLRSFSPDASFFENSDERDPFGPIPHPPRFAVEVREADDAGPPFERVLRQKIADYFAAGTLVVWDVDLQADEVIAKYSAAEPMRPQIFRRGEMADAQPAVPGWTMSVDQLFVPPRRTVA